MCLAKFRWQFFSSSLRYSTTFSNFHFFVIQIKCHKSSKNCRLQLILALPHPMIYYLWPHFFTVCYPTCVWCCVKFSNFFDYFWARYKHFPKGLSFSLYFAYFLRSGSKPEKPGKKNRFEILGRKKHIFGGICYYLLLYFLQWCYKFI